jgi:hypothetical protein
MTRNGTPPLHGDVTYLSPSAKKLGISIAATYAFRHGRISLVRQNSATRDLIREWVTRR